MNAPERIWVQWPHVNGAGLAFSCNARPPAKRTEYVRADRIAALEAEVARLRDVLQSIADANGHPVDFINRARAALEGVVRDRSPTQSDR